MSVRVQKKFSTNGFANLFSLYINFFYRQNLRFI